MDIFTLYIHPFSHDLSGLLEILYGYHIYEWNL